jgi:thiol-disulfide isomerase/thioredoxin
MNKKVIMILSGIVIIIIFGVFAYSSINGGLTGRTASSLTGRTASSLTGRTALTNQTNSEKVVIYFFWGDGCPHCTNQKPYMKALQEKYPEIEIIDFETWKNPDNKITFNDIAKKYGFEARGVPTTFIGEKYWIGFNVKMISEMEGEIERCISNGCLSPAERE